MAVIYWTQADGWPSPNTTDGDTSCCGWSSVSTTNGNIDTVAYSGTGTYAPTNAWQISGLNLISDAARFLISLPYAIKVVSCSGVFVLPAHATFTDGQRLTLIESATRSFQVRRSSTKLVIQIVASDAALNAYGTVSLTDYAGKPLLFECDIDANNGGTTAFRVYDYSTGAAGALIDSISSTAPNDNRTNYTFIVGGKALSAVGALGNYQLTEFQIRDAAGHHVANPYIGYPTGHVFKTETFADDELLTADADWKHYYGTAGKLEKSGGSLVNNTDGTAEAAVLETNPVLAQGIASVEISNLQTDDRAGIVLAQHTTDFNPSTGVTGGSIAEAYYRIYVDDNGGSPNLVIDLDVDGSITPIDSTAITGSTTGTLTVYNRWSGVDARLYATFNNGDPFNAESNDYTAYPAQYGVWIERDSGAGTTLDNFSVTSQYPADYTFFELARFCNGSYGNGLGHPAVIQSPKYNQTVIFGYAGTGAETSKDSKMWAWVVPLDGVTEQADILGPVEIDAGDGSTYRVAGQSGGTFDGQAVLVWPRDAWTTPTNGQTDWPNDVKQLCGAIHMGDLSFKFPDGKLITDETLTASSRVLTVGKDDMGLGATTITDYRPHVKGHGFQRGTNLVIPGIRTFDDSDNSLGRGIFTMFIPITGSTFGTVIGGTVTDGSVGEDEWALYPESDDEWWGFARSSGTSPVVFKSTDTGETWTLQDGTSGKTYFPLIQSGVTPIDGQLLQGGEFILHGPIEFRPAVGAAGFRKKVSAIPVSSSAVFDTGIQFDRSDEINLLWNWTRDGQDVKGYMGYGQITSTPAGDMMACYAQRSSTAGGGEQAAQMFLIQIPQAITEYTPWENPYGVVSTRMALTGVGT